MGKVISLFLLILLAISGAAGADQNLIIGQVEEPLEINGMTEGYPSEPWEEGNFKLYLAHDGELMYVHLTVKTEGWIAIGFTTPGGGMHGSNMFLGFQENDEGRIRDDVAIGRTHSAVEDSAVKEYFVSKEEGVFILEFSYPLQFPEDKGFILAGINPGETIGIILAYHNSSHNIRTRHSNRASLNAEIE